ncbi:MAG: MMPL family transporter [Planctomycetes bacterium]|nr:MMPL family transporter [Planctomycetota bacterium]
MGWLGVHLDIATVMLASVTFGLAVDATIHYLHRVRQERRAGRTASAALLRAHATIGVSIFHASAIAVVAFWVYALSNFRPNVTFGLATGLAMAVGLFATLLLLPALLSRGSEHR